MREWVALAEELLQGGCARCCLRVLLDGALLLALLLVSRRLLCFDLVDSLPVGRAIWKEELGVGRDGASGVDLHCAIAIVNRESSVGSVA